MATGIFDDKNHLPNDRDLTVTLGRSKMHWDRIREHIGDQYPPLTDKWNYAGAKYGRSYRLIQTKRTIRYMIPNKKHFLVAFVFGEKAVHKALASDLPASVKQLIRSAQKYVEGRGVRFEVRTKKEVEIVRKLAEIKMMK